MASKSSGRTPSTLNDVHFVSLTLPVYSVSTGCPMNSTLPVSLPRRLPLFPLAVPLRRVLHPACPTFMASMHCCCTSSSNSSSSLHVSSALQSLTNHLQLWVARNPPHPHRHLAQRCHHLHQTCLQECAVVVTTVRQVRGYGLVDDASSPAAWLKLPTLLNRSGTVPLCYHYVTVPSFPHYGDCKNYCLEIVHGRTATTAVKMTASGV